MAWFSNEAEIKIVNDLNIKNLSPYTLFVLLVIILAFYYITQKYQAMEKRAPDLEARF